VSLCLLFPANQAKIFAMVAFHVDSCYR